MPSMTITNLFLDLGDHKTRLVSTTEYATEEDLKLVIEMGVISGATESWDRLVEHLDAIQNIV